jgi:hypothetical protein
VSHATTRSSHSLEAVLPALVDVRLLQVERGVERAVQVRQLPHSLYIVRRGAAAFARFAFLFNWKVSTFGKTESWREQLSC